MCKMPYRVLNGIDLQETLLQRRRCRGAAHFAYRSRQYPNVRTGDESRGGRFPSRSPSPEAGRALLQCVQRALIRSQEQRRRAAEKEQTRALLDLLTPREFEVMHLLTTGMLNKQVGGELGMAEKTVKVHRGNLMKKLGITSVAELVRLVERAQACHTAADARRASVA